MKKIIVNLLTKSGEKIEIPVCSIFIDRQDFIDHIYDWIGKNLLILDYVAEWSITIYDAGDGYGKK